MKILIRLPNWLGDVVMSTALINAVKQYYPDAIIDLIIKKELSSIAPLIPGINKIHSFSKHDNKGLTGVFRFGKSLRSEKYDLYFNLPSSLSSLLMARATGAKKRIGYKKEGGFFFLTKAFEKPLHVHRVDEYVSLLEQYTNQKITQKTVGLTLSDPVEKIADRVLINFNSEAASRRMPVEKGIAIINALTNTFKNINFVFIGSPKENEFIEQIITQADNLSRIENLAGKTDLVGLCKLMAGSSAIITTDSGPAHLANAFNLPSIVLFGAGNEHNTAPYNKEHLDILRYGKLDCEPCVKNTCELYGIPKCMQMIDELRIISTLSVYLRHA